MQSFAEEFVDLDRLIVSAEQSSRGNIEIVSRKWLFDFPF